MPKQVDNTTFHYYVKVTDERSNPIEVVYTHQELQDKLKVSDPYHNNTFKKVACATLQGCKMHYLVPKGDGFPMKEFKHRGVDIFVTIKLNQGTDNDSKKED